MEEVAGSIPASSTLRAFIDTLRSVGFVLGGLVAGEGCFSVSPAGRRADGSERLRYTFRLRMAARDRPAVEALQSFLGTGSIRDRASRRPGHLPTAEYAVTGRRALRERVIPFGEMFLVPSAKRDQFDVWCAAFMDYERTFPTQWGRGPSECSVEGCQRPVRGRGLCRSHYHDVTGY